MTASVQEIERSAAPARVAPRDSAPVVSLLGASFDTGNLGVSALASGTIGALRRAFPRARLFLLDYGTPPLAPAGGGEPLPVLQVNLRFSKRVWLPNNVVRLLLLAAAIRLVPVRAWRRGLARRNRWLRRLVDTDLHLALSGGDSFSDLYGLGRLAYMGLPQVLVLLLERPLVLLPQTYGPFKRRASRAFARYIMLRSNGIYSRDREGLAVVGRLLQGRGPRPRLAFDMGFGMEPLPPPPETLARVQALKAGGPLVGFNISGLLKLGGYGRGNDYELQCDYGVLIGMLLDLLATGRHAQVLLVPHVHGEGAGSEDDGAACRDIVHRLGSRHGGRLHVLDGVFGHRETKHIIGQCDFFLGSRMHACIAALSQVVPAVGLAYSRKFAGVMETVGAGAAVADLRTMKPEEVAGVVDAAWQRREEMRGQLRARMPEIRSSVLGFFQQPEVRALLQPSLP